MAVGLNVEVVFLGTTLWVGFCWPNEGTFQGPLFLSEALCRQVVWVGRSFLTNQGWVLEYLEGSVDLT